MPLPAIIGLVSGLASVVPSVLELCKGKKAAARARTVVDIARSVTGESDDKVAVDIIKQDPAMAQQFIAQYNQFAVTEMEEDTKRQAMVNETMRVEYETSGQYKTGWRPFWGWSCGFAFAIQMLAFTAILLILVINIFDPKTITVDDGKGNVQTVGIGEQVAEVVKAIGNLMPYIALMWTIALSVLGVAIGKRSGDKRAAMGMAPGTGLIQKLVDKVGAAF